MHWSMFGGLVLLVIVGLLIADRVGTAYASIDQFWSIIEEAVVHNKDVREHIGIYVEEQELDSERTDDKAIARRVVAEKTVKVLADAYIVMGNVREDSESIHDVLLEGFEKLGDKPGATLEDIRKQLEVMNKALKAMPPIKDQMEEMNRKMSSVPVMAAHMDLMNRNIASMTTSMGSTMGRMGKWMPW